MLRSSLSLYSVQSASMRDKQRQALREFFSSACDISARFLYPTRIIIRKMEARVKPHVRLTLDWSINLWQKPRKPWISLKFVTIPTEIRTAPEDLPSIQWRKSSTVRRSSWPGWVKQTSSSTREMPERDLACAGVTETACPQGDACFICLLFDEAMIQGFVFPIIKIDCHCPAALHPFLSDRTRAPAARRYCVSSRSGFPAASR